MNTFCCSFALYIYIYHEQVEVQFVSSLYSGVAMFVIHLELQMFNVILRCRSAVERQSERL